MGITDFRVYVLACDGCEDDYEGDFGDIYYEDDTKLTEEARANGWDIPDERYADTICPDCVTTRRLGAEGKPAPIVNIPGQLAIPFAKAAA